MAVELRASLGKLSGDPQQDVKVMYNYVMQLTEELRYALNNIGISNLNDKELARYENGRLSVFANEIELHTNELRLEFGTMEETLRSLISAEAGRIDLIVQGIGRDGTVDAASIVAAINATTGESLVQISADHIELNGVVTISDLESGETSISGDWIRSGTISGATLYSESGGDTLYPSSVEISNATVLFRYQGGRYQASLALDRNNFILELSDGVSFKILQNGEYITLGGSNEEVS